VIVESKDIFDKLIGSLNDSKSLFAHCMRVPDKHTEAGIEAAFLQLTTSWESFLEDSTVIFLCGKMPLSGIQIEPKFMVSDMEDARGILFNGNRFTDWLRTNDLISRYRTFFKVDNERDNRFTKAIKKYGEILNDVRVIRNAIAHSSKSSIEEIDKIYVREVGVQHNIKRPAGFLSKYSKQSITHHYFSFYTLMVEFIAKEIIC